MTLAADHTTAPEIVVEHRGEEFILVPARYGFELMTVDYLPVASAYPVSPQTGRHYSVGNIEPQRKSAGFYGRRSEGWRAPQIRGDASATPEGAALRLLKWLDRKAKGGKAVTR